MTLGPKVFVCHSSRDHEFVHKLAADLNRDGVEVWVDEGEIRVGDRLRDKIERGIEDSDYIIVVLSRASTHRGWRSSRWVHVELDAAFIDQVQNRRKVILPCRVEPCQVPKLIRGLAYADFATKPYGQAYSELLGALLPEGPISVEVQAELKRLQSPDPDVRIKAVSALRDCRAWAAVSALARTLSDADVEVRRAVLRAFIALGMDVFQLMAVFGEEMAQRPLQTAIHAMARALGDEDKSTGHLAAMALIAVCMGEAANVFTEALGAGDARTRARAAFGLGLLAASEGAEPLAAALADADPEVREAAQEALRRIGRLSA